MCSPVPPPPSQFNITPPPFFNTQTHMLGDMNKRGSEGDVSCRCVEASVASHGSWKMTLFPNSVMI